MWRESENCSCNKWPLWCSKLFKESSRCQDVFAKAFFSLCKFITTLCSMKLREFTDSNPFLTLCLHSRPKVQNSKVHKVHVNLMYSSVFCEHRDRSKPLIMTVKHNCWKKSPQNCVKVGKETNCTLIPAITVTFRSDATTIQMFVLHLPWFMVAGAGHVAWLGCGNYWRTMFYRFNTHIHKT
jgi:hypothetical protein